MQVKICNQKPINFFRDYWFGLLLMMIELLFIPNLDIAILEIILPDLLNPVQAQAVLNLVTLVAIVGTWYKFIGKKPSISFK